MDSKNFALALFARPSFVGGISRILDFGNTLNVYDSLAKSSADSTALSSDLQAIAGDFREAIAIYKAQQNK